MKRKTKLEKIKDGFKNFWYNVVDRGVLEAIDIFYSNFFKDKTHKFETQTPYGDWQSHGERLRDVIIFEFLEFAEFHAYPRWKDGSSKVESVPDFDKVLESFDLQMEHYQELEISGEHIIALKECKKAYFILRKRIPELEKEKENAKNWEVWGEYDDKIIQSKYEAASLISDHLGWMWM